MLRVWVDGRPVGVLDRFGPRGSAFVYEPDVAAGDAVSLTMPPRTASWDAKFGLPPIFDMNLPEGALRERLRLAFAKAVGTFDDFDLLSVVGRSQIGRVRVTGIDETLDEKVPFQSVDEVLRARRDGGLFDYLLERFAAYSGVSGVQPKVLIRAKDEEAERLSSTLRGATHIVKLWDPREYPELAANEFFCMSAAKALGLVVPEFRLSDDGAALVVERFDHEHGRYRGFEDFCVLNALSTAEKYKGGYEARLFKRMREFASPERRQEALVEMFRLFVLNAAIRNGDAHLKQFGVLYGDAQGQVAAAPAYDLVSTRVYLPNDQMALTLDGSTNWPDRKKLLMLGRTRADLPPRKIERILEQTADVLADLRGEVLHHFRANTPTPEVGDRLVEVWGEGISQSLGLAGRLLPAARMPETPDADAPTPTV